MQISGRLANCDLKAFCSDIQLCLYTHHGDIPGLNQIHTILYLIFLSKCFDVSSDIFPMVNHETGQCFLQFLVLYSCKTLIGLNCMIKGSSAGAKNGRMQREYRCLQQLLLEYGAFHLKSGLDQ